MAAVHKHRILPPREPDATELEMATYLVESHIESALTSLVDELDDKELEAFADLTEESEHDAIIHIYATYHLYKRSNSPERLKQAARSLKRLVEAAAKGDAGHALQLRILVQMLADLAQHEFTSRTGGAAAAGVFFEGPTLREDLDYAISLATTALDSTQSDHPGRFMILNNIGAWLGLRFNECTHLKDDLDLAIEYSWGAKDGAEKVAQDATPAVADHSDRDAVFIQFAGLLAIRIDLNNQDLTRHPEREEELATDLDTSIGSLPNILANIPRDHPERTRLLINLGAHFGRRFERFSRDNDDLNQAIKFTREGLQNHYFLDPDSPTVSNLQQLRKWRKDLSSSVDNGLDAVQTGSASTRVSPDQPDRGDLSTKFENLRSTHAATNRRLDFEGSPPIDTIQSEIKFASSNKDGAMFASECRVLWNILKFGEEELDPGATLQGVATLTGTHINAEMNSCGEFTRKVWASSALIEFLDQYMRNPLKFKGFVKLYEDTTLSIDDEKEIKYPGYMRFSVSGPLPEVARLIQQLAWITAAFEPPKKNVLTVSTAFVDIVPGMIDIRPRELDSQALLRGPSDSKANASCWHQLLPGAVLAYGFPISERKEGIGLEIPFDFMVSLADIRTKIDVAEGVTLLGGPEILLYPTQILECGVQWHCTEIDGNRSGEHGQVPTGALPNQSLQDLSNRRAFLGFWTKSQVLLGTQDLVETLRARKDLESRFKKAPGGIELAREAIFSAGFSFNAQASIGVKAVFSRTLQVSLEEGRTYFDLVDKAAVQPTIIYDEQTKSGWVISEMSLALHVALSYLSNPRVQERRHSGPEPLEGDWPQLPFAEPCADGGSEARRICIESTNCQIKLWSENGKTKTFCKVIEDVLRDFRAIKTATLAQNRQSGWRPEFMRPGLRGWEYSEFVSRESVIFQKEVPFKGHEAPWWELERVDGMLAFFGRGLGELIKPMHSSRHPSGLSAIPPGSRLLVASRPCLENNLKGAAEKGKRLVGSLEWTSATAKRYCNDACDTTSCLSIQILGRTSSSSGTSPNRQVLDAEVIMFGEPEYYHKALIEQKARRGNSWNG